MTGSGSIDTEFSCPRCGSLEVSGADLVICHKCGYQIRPRSPGAKPIVLDSNVYDVIVASATDLAAVRSVCLGGQVELLLTHIQYDELAAIKDTAKRVASFSIPFVIETTAGIVLDVSKAGLARFGGESTVDAIRSPTGGHARDALIASTAKEAGATLVMGDERLRTRATSEGITV